jgi:hypothetical protein
MHGKINANRTESKRSNRIGASISSLEDGSRSSFRNVVFSSYLEFWIVDRVQRPNDSEH